MGKVDSYYISLDNPLATYYAGQTVTGKVILKLNEELSLKGIYLRINGEANVRWSEQETPPGRNTKSRRVFRSDSHTYFNYEMPLLQVPESEEKVDLAAGNYEYSFSQLLPTNLPSSFEGSCGQIRYTVSSSISRPWRFDPKCLAVFTVLEVVDLNTLPGIDLPCNGQNSKTLGFMCCLKSGSISTLLTLNKQGYVPGENLSINADINNSSDLSITDVTSTLICMITYRAGTYSKLERLNISSVNHGLVQPHCKEQWSNEPLSIPSIHPTRVGAAMCRLINLEYFVELKVKPSRRLSRAVETTVPVTIGSVPLVTDFHTFATTSAPPMEHLGGEIPFYNHYPNLPPPTCMESCGGNVKIDNEDNDDETKATGNFSYNPRYHFYAQGNPLS